MTNHMTRLQAGWCVARLLAREKQFSCLQNIHNHSRAHPASYSMGTAVSFPGGQAVVVQAWPLTWQGLEWMQPYHCLHCILKDIFIFLCLVIQGLTLYSLISTTMAEEHKISRFLWNKWNKHSGIYLYGNLGEDRGQIIPRYIFKTSPYIDVPLQTYENKSNISLSISIMAK